MSMCNLSIDGEFRYIVQWFNEWSELQRDDFVPVLLEYLTKETSSDSSSAHMNGIISAVANVDIHGKPMSLFQCRIKLFRQWSAKWPIEFKHKLQEKITEIDTNIGEKIKAHTLNGDTNNEIDNEANIDAVLVVDDEATNIDNLPIVLPDNETTVDNNDAVDDDYDDGHEVKMQTLEQHVDVAVVANNAGVTSLA